MPNFDESNLCFSFGNEWQVIKVDQHPDYLNVFQNIPGTKAVDFLGMHGGTVYLIEVKNFSANLAIDEPRIRGDDLSNILAQKFRDTLFVVLAGHYRYRRPDWQLYATAMEQNAPLKFVSWIELDYQSRNAVQQKRLQALWNILTQKLKQKVGHLNRYDINFHILITASNLQKVLDDLIVHDAPC